MLILFGKNFLFGKKKIDNLNAREVTDKNIFWKIIKTVNSEKINILGGNVIHSEDKVIA